MITITNRALLKLRNLVTSELPALRLSVQGGGCSGFSYHMELTNEKNLMDKEFFFGDIKVLVDSISLTYLEGTEIDYAEDLIQSGFKFNNPNVKSTCGCGHSFNA